MDHSLVATLCALMAGVCAGYSGLFQLHRPHPGWFIAAVLSLWLAVLYAGGHVT